MDLEPGTLELIDDLKEVLAEAEAGEFGDFTNEKYDFPKLQLVKKLEKLIENVKEGKYV